MKTNQLLIIVGLLLAASFSPVFSHNQPGILQTTNPPTWNVDPSLFSLDGDVTAQVLIDRSAMTSGNDILAAFVGECRCVKTGGVTGPSWSLVCSLGKLFCSNELLNFLCHALEF